MNSTLPESDWRAFKVIQGRAQDRACQAALAEAGRLIADQGRSAHDRFRDVCRFLEAQEQAFDRDLTDLRRSTALAMLQIMDRRGLLTEGDLTMLGAETREFLVRFRGTA